MNRASNQENAPPCFAAIGDDRCTGCAACANACPCYAIEIRLNRQGYYRPVLRPGVCRNCGICMHSCPVNALIQDSKSICKNKTGPLDVFAAWSTDKKVHNSSSSGGIFSELARYILEQGGIVCGCTWGDNWTPHHIIVKDWSNVAKLRGSKYIPSLVDNQFYRDIIDFAKGGIPVLFCGTPCQIAGLDLLAPPEARENLLLVDLVCHGVPSLISFWRYLDWMFKNDQIDSFSFRNKETSATAIYVRTINGRRYLSPVGSDTWYRMAMIYHLFLQRSCYECLFDGIPRMGDVTLGDFWGIPKQWHDPLGDSVVLANTKKGRRTVSLLVETNRIAVNASDYQTASKASRRLRGVVYPIPRFRWFALQLLTHQKSFGWIIHLCYRPLRFGEHLRAYLQRQRLLLSYLGNHCRKQVHECS